MASYALFLRGINVGGNKSVPMADLRKLIESLGFSGAQTLLQSGNAVFQGPAQASAALERRFEAAVVKRFGFASDCIVRTAKEWTALMAANPFPSEARGDPAHLLVVLLRDKPKPGALAAVRAAIQGPERVELSGRQLFVVYPAGQGTSKFTLPVIEKALGTRGTGRNWNTVTKVADLLKD